MIGYYVHHQGSGHLHRACAIEAAADYPLTGLSSLARPAGWRGAWIQLADDHGGPQRDADAHGRLHYAPQHHRGLRGRMSAIARWIEAAAPTALVVDVSVEVTMLARLFGVPVLVMAQPGVRADSAHQLAYDVAAAVISPWPRTADALLNPAASRPARTAWVGAISRFGEPVAGTPADSGRRRVLALNGTGGEGPTETMLGDAIAATPSWDWTVLDRGRGTWLENPWPAICAADALVSHAGQNAVAEIAAARKPALIIAQDRPFGEQRVTAAALARLRLPVVVADSWPTVSAWPDVLSAVGQLSGKGWVRWNDGGGASRAAAAIAIAARSTVFSPEESARHEPALPESATPDSAPDAAAPVPA